MTNRVSRALLCFETCLKVGGDGNGAEEASVMHLHGVKAPCDEMALRRGFNLVCRHDSNENQSSEIIAGSIRGVLWFGFHAARHAWQQCGGATSRCISLYIAVSTIPKRQFPPSSARNAFSTPSVLCRLHYPEVWNPLPFTRRLNSAGAAIQHFPCRFHTCSFSCMQLSRSLRLADLHAVALVPRFAG